MSFVNIHGEPLDMRSPAYAARMVQARRAQGKRKPTVLNGYAAPPGSGPEGETCKTCRFKHSMGSQSGSKHFIKCDANEARWTHGEGSDIRASSPACRAWEKRA